MNILFFVLGLIALTVGADILVRGAAAIAARFGISQLIIGLTIVAFGTSAPELAVSIGAALRGNVDIAIGNVVGSNICNVLLILGVCAAIKPLHVNAQLVRIDLPIMIAVSFSLLFLSLDGVVGRLDGALLVLALGAYLLFLWKLNARQKVESEAETFHPSRSRLLLELGQVVLGLALLVFGADRLVVAAVEFARVLGVDDVVIGLTVVAVGTSLPEIATSVAASLKGKGDIAVGNVVGSNIFNILGVLGVSAAVGPNGLLPTERIFAQDLPIMLGVAVICLPIFWSGLRISRFEGVLLLLLYCIYSYALVLSAQLHPFGDLLAGYLIWMALPAIFIVSMIWALRSRQLRECNPSASN